MTAEANSSRMAFKEFLLPANRLPSTDSPKWLRFGFKVWQLPQETCQVCRSFKERWPRAFARDHFGGDPSGIRTRVTAVRGRRTRPLYDGAVYISVLLPAFPLIKLSDSFTHFALVSNRRTG